MKYRGFEITPNYLPGSDFRLTVQGRVLARVPKKEDINFYSVEHVKTGDTLPNMSSIKEAKDFIDFYIGLPSDG